MRSRARLNLDLPAVGRGALLGLAVILPASLADLVLSRIEGLDDGFLVFVLFGAILTAFFLAGHRAARTATGSPYTHGALGGLGAFALWLPVRIATRALVGEQLLGREGDAAFEVAQAVLTAALLSMSFGILGGLVASRRDRRPRPGPAGGPPSWR